MDYDFPDDVPTIPFHEDVTAVYAGRGGGKTTKAKELLKEHQPKILVWLDPLNGPEPNLDDLEASILAGNRTTMFNASNREMAMAAIMTCYRLSSKDRRIFLVCDEAGNYLKQYSEYMRQVFHIGRHKGLGILLISQRPASLNTAYRSQAATTHLGPIGQTELSIATEVFGADLAKGQMDAPVGSFIKTL